MICKLVQLGLRLQKKIIYLKVFDGGLALPSHVHDIDIRIEIGHPKQKGFRLINALTIRGGPHDACTLVQLLHIQRVVKVASVPHFDLSLGLLAWGNVRGSWL